MKVLFVSSGNSFYGISPIITRQGISLQKKGIEIEYFGIKGRGLKGYLRNIFLLREFLKLSNPDIIHAHYGLSAIVAFLAKGRRKIIVSFMGSDVLGYKDLNRVYNFISKVSIIINKFLARFYYNHIMVKSEEMLQKFSKSNKISLIPNGIDINDFSFLGKEEAREELKQNNEEKIVLFISNPGRAEKNYDLTLDAVRLIEYKIKVIPVFNNSLDKLKYYYSAADVLVMTSLHEGSPNVVKEAMACNCPVVSTDVGNVNWLFGETMGYYISSYDPVDIAGKIKLAIDFREKYGKTRGRERIIELGLDSETVAGKIIKVYKKVLSIDD